MIAPAFARQACVALFACVAAASASAAEWRLASGFAPSVFHVRNLERFAADASDAEASALRVSLHASGTLLPLGAMLDGVANGDVEMGEVLLSDLGALDPLFELDALPFVATSYAQARRLWAASRELVAARLEARGLRLLFAVPWPPQGLFSKRPLETVEDFDGLGMRVYNRSTEALANLVGASPMRLRPAELGAEMAADRLHLMLLPASTGVNIDAPYYFAHFYDARAWLPKNVVVANAVAFDALSDTEQAALLAAAERARDTGWRSSERVHIERTAAVRLRGAKVEPPSAALRRSFIDIGRRFLVDWSDRVGADASAVVERYYAQ